MKLRLALVFVITLVLATMVASGVNQYRDGDIQLSRAIVTGTICVFGSVFSQLLPPKKADSSQAEG